MNGAPESPKPIVVEMADVDVASIHAPDSVAVQNVQWTVRQSEFWVIGGSPGSGKSDLLATAAGLMRPMRGTHRLFGQSTANLHEDERIRMQLRVGVVFGYGGRLFRQLTIAENLALPWCYHRDCSGTGNEERVSAVLEVLELTRAANKMPAMLDRSIQQRAGLARALVLSPEVLFIENPLVGAGPRELRWWLRFVNELFAGHPILGGRRPTLVVGTHDLRPWTSHGQQFAFVHDRRFLPVGGREELSRQSDPVLRELLAVEPFEQ